LLGISECSRWFRRHDRRAMSSFVKNPLKVGEPIEKLVDDDLHARRVMSLANGVGGVLDAASP